MLRVGPQYAGLPCRPRIVCVDVPRDKGKNQDACRRSRYDSPSAYGHIEGLDDPSMGWARYAQARLRQPAPSAWGMPSSSARACSALALEGLSGASCKSWCLSTCSAPDVLCVCMHGDILIITVQYKPYSTSHCSGHVVACPRGK